MLERRKRKEEYETMNYAEWLVNVPSEIINDPIWKLEVYRLGLFAGDIGIINPVTFYQPKSSNTAWDSQPVSSVC
jgi:hypothetical protein